MGYAVHFTASFDNIIVTFILNKLSLFLDNFFRHENRHSLTSMRHDNKRRKVKECNSQHAVCGVKE